ncbi:MAG TPA: undecaprenyl-diphosphate phosphatase [Candidatus Monoglobus merdigallinarum]|uniref:Undecaprenyl-diphosphatase n=1 Tax=Candidatus Monoglobus merdigallinarum TaxID=2838698 RepID=A0A9D1TM15_9FIRM|nr:undecaprenyl-diphosphate phosphatase [Candidatus Monoglobus merdigallinarum]
MLGGKLILELNFIELLKVIFLGIVEGITEWLPISSTGHMILVDEFIKLNVSPEFLEFFLVAIQLGAIMAVVVIFFNKIFPFEFRGGFKADREKLILWAKIIVASIPAGVIGILFDDIFSAWFYNPWTVAVMLILFGVLFIVIENSNKNKLPKVDDIRDITYKTAFIIGVFQLIAAVFPGTSRSGATIVGALLLGVSRTASAEFTFYLAIPAMFGGSLVKLLKFGFSFTPEELIILLVGGVVAFVVSMLSIKFLMSYVKKHDFKVFGWYRIVLGVLVLGYFLVKAFI